MSKKADKPLAKSLHTITVLVRMADTVWQYEGDKTKEEALDMALECLGLAGKADPYELRAAALKQLEA